MLSQTFDETNLKDILIPADEWRPHPKWADRKAWTLPTDAMRRAHILRGEAAAKFEWPVAPATFFLDYQRTGNRTRWQGQVRDARRNALGDLVMAECLEGNGRFIDNIIDGIWTTCEETFWGVPAHMSRQKAGVGLPDVEEPIVDLFAAEAAALLAWTWYLVGDQLDTHSSLIGDRIKLEINRRILMPCQDRNFNWMGFDNPERRVNNWNPWIISNWLTCALIIEADQVLRAKLVARALQALDNFIDPYPKDGGCDEGPGYWNRAGGTLYDCLEILLSASNARIDVYDDPVIQEIGRFPHRTQISGSYFVNFADAAARVSLPPSVIFGYGKRIGDPDMMAIGAWSAGVEKLAEAGMDDSLGRQLRSLPLLEEILATEPRQPLPDTTWLPDIEVVCARDKTGTTDGFFVAAKGGHNEESHNHNDIGHFVVYLDGCPLIVDIGVENYTSKTFGPDRYDIWTMNSQHHSLPTVNGVQQSPGGEFRAQNVVHTADSDTVTFGCDISSAYGNDAGIEVWNREISFARGSHVVVTDNFELSKAESLEMNLMTPCKVSVDGNTVTFTEVPLSAGLTSASGKLTFDSDAFTVSTHVHPLAEIDFKLGNPWGETLTRIVFIAKQPKLIDQWEWKIESA
jgi:hypothetical protein